MKIGSGMSLEAIVLGLVLLFIAAFAYTASTGIHQWSGAASPACLLYTSDAADGLLSVAPGGSRILK